MESIAVVVICVVLSVLLLVLLLKKTYFSKPCDSILERPSNPNVSHAAKVLKAKKQTKLLKATGSKKKKVLFAPVNIWTGPENIKNSNDTPFCPPKYIGQFKDTETMYGKKQCYKGSVDNNENPDVPDDINSRWEVVTKAFDIFKNSDNFKTMTDDMLPVFALPEFFFRSIEGGYKLNNLGYPNSKDSENFNAIKSLFDKMKQMASDNPNVLFVFGTVILYDSINKHHHVMNVCPIMYGHTHILVQKHYVSDVDFIQVLEEGNSYMLPNPTLGTEQMSGTKNFDKKVYAMYDFEHEQAFASKFGFQYSDNLFHVAGLRFAIDICLDHRQNVALSQLKKNKCLVNDGYKPFYAGDGTVHDKTKDTDVHLVISAGMTIWPKHLTLGKTKGVVLLCDGEERVSAAVDGGINNAISAAEPVKKDASKQKTLIETNRVKDVSSTGNNLITSQDEYDNFRKVFAHDSIYLDDFPKERTKDYTIVNFYLKNKGPKLAIYSDLSL